MDTKSYKPVGWVILNRKRIIFLNFIFPGVHWGLLSFTLTYCYLASCIHISLMLYHICFVGMWEHADDVLLNHYNADCWTKDTWGFCIFGKISWPVLIYIYYEVLVYWYINKYIYIYTCIYRKREKEQMSYGVHSLLHFFSYDIL